MVFVELLIEARIQTRIHELRVAFVQNFWLMLLFWRHILTFSITVWTFNSDLFEKLVDKFEFYKMVDTFCIEINWLNFCNKQITLNNSTITLISWTI